MRLFPNIGFGTAPPVCNTDDLYNLLISVLPTFDALSDSKWKRLEASNTSMEILNFYLHFRAKIVNLNSALRVWDPTETVQRLSADEAEVQNNLLRVLDELEARFLSWKGGEVGLACRRLRLERRKDETYPKLRALRRILLEDESLDENSLSALTVITRIDNKRADKREKLLQNLDQAFSFFCSLQPPSTESDSQCPIRFSNYPLRHIRKFTTSLFKVLQRNWSCQCLNSSSHVSRKTRLNLTQHQRFEMAPNNGRVLPNSKALFRILFPTSSRDLEWQDAEIAVKNCDHEHAEHREVEHGLCGILQGVKAGIRPRMVIFAEKLWQLEADIEINHLCSPQVRDSEFKSLRRLLKPNQSSHKSLLSSIDGKDRLILSFVLATSLLHFFGGPWLQASLNSENISFLVSHSRLSPDITKPYLTTSCASMALGSKPRRLNEPHRFPDILSLGILLLEIGRGSPIDFEEPQDRCVVALECYDKWRKSCRTSRSRAVPDGLYRAILACIDPKEFRKNSLDKTSVTDFDVRKYIFERILFPLEDALSTAYEIQLDTLHTDIARTKKASEVGSFDHNVEHRPDKRQAAHGWREYLNGVHDLVYDCIERCENLSEGDQNAARVKVAVLDTGLQLPEDLQANYEDAGRINIEESESFLLDTNGATSHDWKVDCDGHGTHVGQIILEVTPAANLHVARVFKSRDDLENPKTATQIYKRIVEAIDRATNKWRVDMIVMCFGFGEPIPLIRDAIEKASKSEKPPLLFAATRNDGAHKRMAWPARDPLVIGISSTDGDGDASPFNPTERDAHPILYAFGEGVPIKAAAPDTTTYISGTSYATPVAAGLAANLLGCVRMMAKASSREDQCIYNHVPLEMQRMRGMLAVLRHRMCKKHNCGLSSLLPWDFLKPSQLDNNNLLKEISEVLKEL